MTDWVREKHKKRCEGKQSFRKATKADALAERMTHKTGELIISYQCCDCGRWHVGHADEAQILARVPSSKPSCVVCKGLISEARLQKAQYYRSKTMICSKACTRKLRRRRVRLRNQASHGSAEGIT